MIDFVIAGVPETELTIGPSGPTSVNFKSARAGKRDSIIYTPPAAIDPIPSAFSFSPANGVSLNTLTTSNQITPSGFNTATSVTITGGEYQIGAGVWTTAPGSILPGQTIRVRHTSSVSNGTVVNTVLTIGGVSAVFTSTTVAAVDTTPDAFSLTDVTTQARSSLVQSNLIAISGINAPANVTITGGEWQKNGGAWVNTSGTVVDGDQIRVRHTTSASYSTATNTILTIGGVSDTFTTTTLAAPADTTPNAFTFTDVSGQTRSAVITSNYITVAGIDAPATITITGGEYQIGSGAWTTASGTVNSGDQVRVRHTASASYSTATNTILTIGGVSDTFTTTTLAAPADTTPNAFTFTDVSGQTRSAVITSNQITISGIDAPATITITGGEYQINNGAWVTASGTVNNGDLVRVRHTASASYSTATNTVLTIGGVSDTFTTTTLAAPADTTPNAFAFTDVSTLQIRGVVVTSNQITVSGIDSPAPISVTGGEYQINNGAWVTASGTVNNGDLVRVRHTTAAGFSGTVNTVLTIGGISDTFSSTTEAQDIVPAAFSFTDQSGVTPSSVRTSNSITISNLNDAAPLTITGGEYEKNNSGVWSTAATTVVSGDTVRVRHTSSASNSTAVNTVLTIGGVSDTFTSTTAGYAVTAPVLTPITSDPLDYTINTDADGAIAGDTFRMRFKVNGGAYSYVDEVLDTELSPPYPKLFTVADFGTRVDGDLVAFNIAVVRGGVQVSDWSNELTWTYTISVAPETATTWATENGQNKSQYVTVGGGNLVATGQGGFGDAPISVRATQPRSGKRQFQCLFTGIDANGKVWIGVDDGSDNFNDSNWSRPGRNNTGGVSLAIYAWGCEVYVGGAPAYSGVDWLAAVGDILTCRFDTDAGTVSFYRTRGDVTVQIFEEIDGLAFSSLYANVGLENPSSMTAKFATGQAVPLSSGYVPYDN